MMTQPKTYDLFPASTVFHTVAGRKVINTPNGLEAFRTDVCNVGIIKAGKEQPTQCWMTAYGCSYLSKVHIGTPRSKEFMINVFAGSKNGWMLQISVAGADNNTKLDEATAKTLVSRVVLSLPKSYQKRFVGKRIEIEYGSMPGTIGFVAGTNDKVPA